MLVGGVHSQTSSLLITARRVRRFGIVTVVKALYSLRWRFLRIKLSSSGERLSDLSSLFVFHLIVGAVIVGSLP